MERKECSPYGKWLREARQKAGLSQYKLAELAKIHRLQILYIETGRTQMPMKAAHERIAAVLGEPPDGVIQQSTRRRWGTQEIKKPRRWIYVPQCSFCGFEDEMLFASQTKEETYICTKCLRDLNARVAFVLREQREEMF